MWLDEGRLELAHVLHAARSDSVVLAHHLPRPRHAEGDHVLEFALLGGTVRQTVRATGKLVLLLS